MARVDTLLLEARPDLPGAPDFSITKALLRSAQRFFRESGVWREVIDPITLVEGRGIYSLAAPVVGGRIEWLMQAMLDDQPISISRERDLFSLRETTGTPSAIAIRSHSDEAVVWPSPDSAAVGKRIRLMGAIVPGPKTVSIPDPLLDEWSEGIIAGAKWEMMSMVAMPWSHPEHAQDHERRFNEEVVRAKREQTSGSQSPMKVRPVRFL